MAIRRYIECGGTLVVHGQNVPAVFAEGGAADGGKGVYHVGFGHAMASLAASDSDWDATYQKLVDTPIHIYRPAQKPANLGDLLVKEATVPVRGLFVLVLVFAVGIGPANVWLLSRIQTAHLAVVERAGNLAADLPGRVLLRLVLGRLYRPRQGGQLHAAGRALPSRHDARIPLVLLPADAVGGTAV